MKRLIENIALIISILFLTASVAGFFLDRPLLLSYAYSESMTPTINKGDLFFMNPLVRGGDAGDIIVFHKRDGWTVHRIFAVLDDGYVTKGDHNVATDQQGGAYPVVKRADVAGKVITFMGYPLVIRGGGDFIESMRKHLTNVYAVAVLLLVGALLTFSGGSKKRRHRGGRRFLRLRARTVYALLSMAILAGFVFMVVSSWGTLAFTYSSTLAGGQRDGWYLPGSSFERNLSVRNDAFYPFHYLVGVRGEGATLEGDDGFSLGGRSSRNLSVSVSVPSDTRVYRVEVPVYAYPAILPMAVVRPLYGISPYLPLVPYALELAFILFVFYYLADVGEGDVLRIRRGRRGFLDRIMGDG